MPGGTLHYQLRIRTADDTTDLVTYSSVPADGVYCAIAAPPVGDGQSVQPITGDTQISSYDVDVIDRLLVRNPVVTTLDGFVYATNAAWNAAWTQELPPGTDGTSGGISPNAPAAGTIELDWNGGGGVFGVSDQYYERSFSGFTPGGTYTVSVHVHNLGGFSIDGHQVLGVSGGGVAVMPVGGQGTVSAIAVADGSGNITVQIGVWQKGAIDNGNLFVSALTIQSGIAGQRIVTMVTDDATAQGQLLGLRAVLSFSLDVGATWTVLLAGYVNRVRLVDALRYRWTIGQTRRADQTIRIFDTALGPFNAGSCILGGPIPGGWNGVQDYGPVRWRVLSVEPVGVLLQFVSGPFLSGRLPQLMNRQVGTIGTGQIAYTNARAQQYVPSAFAGLYPYPGAGGLSFGIGAPSGLSARVTRVSDGTSAGTFAPIGSEFQGSGIVLIPPSQQTMIIAWTGTGLDQEGNAQPAQPTVGDLLDCYVYPTAVSSDAPLHLAGHPVDLAAQVLTLAGLPYDATSAADTKAAVGPSVSLALRITSGTTAKDFLATLYGVFGFSTRANGAGALEFFSTNPSTAHVVAATIGVNSLRSDADDVWAQNDATIVNRVSMVLKSFGLWSGDAGQSTPLDLVLAGQNTVAVEDSDANNYGIQEQSWTLEGQITNPLALGHGLTFIAAPTTPASFTLARSQEIFRRVLRGAKEGTLHLLRSQDPGATIGDLVTVDLPHRPAGTVRGGPRLVQIIQRTENPEGPDFRLWDVGGTAVTSAPVPTFTLAADTNDPSHSADAVLTNASAETTAGAVVRVEWGTGASAPTPNGTLLVYLLAPPDALTTVITPPVAAGSTVWVRMRAEVPGVQPSAWSSWQSVTLSGLSGISGLTATAIDGSSELLTWTNTNTTTHLAVYLTGAGLFPNQWVADLPPGTTQYTLTGLDAGASYTAFVQLRESATSAGTTLSVSFTTSATVPTLSAPTQPSAFAGTPDPVTGLVLIDGSYGIQVRANDADAPVTMVVQVAVETSVGSGTPGAFADAGSAPGVLGGFTRIVLSAPNDGLRRYLQAREVKPGYTDSGESTPVVSVNPWSAVALPPTGTLQPVTVDDETAAIPNSRQLVAGSGTAIDTSTPGQIAVDVDLPDGFDFGFGNGSAALQANQHVGCRVPWDCTITAWEQWTEDGASASASVDIQKSSGVNPPSYSAVVGGGTKPNLSGAQWAQVTSITGWTTVTLAAGDLLELTLSTVDGTVKTIRGFLSVTRT